MRRQFLETPFGSLEAQWTCDGLYACEFSRSAKPTSSGDLTNCNAGWNLAMAALTESFCVYFETGIMQACPAQLDWSGVSSFHREVLELCYQIPCGETLTYGELAKAAGRPQAARAVGGAMAKNRWPILIPCHRVVGASGSLTGYSGTGGVATKQALLEMEAEYCGKCQLQLF